MFSSERRYRKAVMTALRKEQAGGWAVVSRDDKFIVQDTENETVAVFDTRPAAVKFGSIITDDRQPNDEEFALILYYLYALRETGGYQYVRYQGIVKAVKSTRWIVRLVNDVRGLKRASDS